MEPILVELSNFVWKPSKAQTLKWFLKFDGYSFNLFLLFSIPRIYDLAFSPDGSFILVAAGNLILVSSFAGES